MKKNYKIFLNEEKIYCINLIYAKLAVYIECIYFLLIFFNDRSGNAVKHIFFC